MYVNGAGKLSSLGMASTAPPLTRIQDVILRTWTLGMLYVSHDRGVTFNPAGILERVGTVWPTVNYSMAFIMPDASVANGTHLYVTEDAGYTFSLREMPGAPVVRCLRAKIT